MLERVESRSAEKGETDPREWWRSYMGAEL